MDILDGYQNYIRINKMLKISILYLFDCGSYAYYKPNTAKNLFY